MKKQKSLFPLFMVMILLLSACSNASSGSHSGGAVIEDEPYEAVDYNLYPSPEGGYVGDVMPFVTDDGTLEIYYLCETDTNGQGYHPIWKYSTKDLCSYKDHGMVLNYGTGADPDPALGTGSVMQDQEGLYHLFYTGHNDNGNGGKGKECVMHASSTDRENWVKDEEPVFSGSFLGRKRSVLLASDRRQGRDPWRCRRQIYFKRSEELGICRSVLRTDGTVHAGMS